MTVTTVVFYCFAAWAVGSALLCITRSNPVSAALWLVSCMFSLAVIFLLLQAEFIAALQVIIYAGAVMVLFLFVIMLLNLEVVPSAWRRRPVWIAGGVLAAALGVTLLGLAAYSPARLAHEFYPGVTNPDPALIFPEGPNLAAATAARGAIGGVAAPLFQTYLVPFEVTSVVLLVAVIGAVVLAKRRL